MGFDVEGIRDEIGPLPWVSGLFRGVLFALISGVLVLLVLYVDAVAAGRTEVLQSGDAAGDLGGYVFLWTVMSAHLVSIEGAGVAVNLVSGFDGALPDLVYYLTPALSLFLAGRFVARSNGHADMSNEALGTMGALVVVGYAPVMVGVAVLSEYQGVGPSMVETVAFAALGFPLVFGFLGGYLAKR